MSSEQPRRSRDNTGSIASPMGSTAAIIIAVVAVVAGFLILRSIRDDGGGGGGAAVTTTPESAITTLPDSVVTTLPPETTPTTSPPTKEGATVIVANASRVDGAAGILTTALEGEGFTMATATNAGGAEPKLDITKIYYDPANPQALPVAQTVANEMGVAEVAVMPVPPPVKDGALPEGVTVLVMLGSDKAALTLAAMSVPTTTVPGAATTLGTETTVAP